MSHEIKLPGAEPSAPQEKRSLEEWVNSEGFEEELARDFPRAAAVYMQKHVDRRTFLRLMGASLVAAGLQGCVSATAPNEEIVPYVRQPEEVIPGIPIYFATAMTLGGYATGLLIETHEGRPTRLEGNPQHPASLGASDLYTQGSVLELYNPDRSVLVRREGAFDSWTDFRLTVADLMTNFEETGGEGLRILTESVSSPTMTAQIEQLLETYPNAQWHQYEPVTDANVVAGSQLAFGEDVTTVYQFENADVVLSLDGDFLASMPGHISYARRFIDGRRVRTANGAPAMNRLYAVESTPTPTGATADNRLALRPSQIAGFALALAAELGVDVGDVPAGDWDANWLAAAAEDLRSAGANAVVVAGPTQPPAVHAAAHAINAALGAVGSTVVYKPAVIASPRNQIEDITTLTEDMLGGDVEALFILGGNPVYDSPADLDFVEALERVPFTMHLSNYFDETSVLCTWHIPRTHYIEEWGDALAYDGTATIVQPPIGPLYERVRSAHDVLAAMLGDRRSAYEIVRSNWEENYTGTDFDTFWRQALNDGVVPGSTPDNISPTLSGSLAADIAGSVTPGTGLEVSFRADPTIYDGRFAFNSWLQELPKPVIDLTWDNAGIISPDTATRLGVVSGSLMNVSVDGRTMQVPALVVTGQADDTVTIQLGFGRGLSAEVDAGLNFNAYTIRSTDSIWFATNASVNAAGGTYDLAVTRGDFLDEEQAETDAILTGTLSAFVADPEFFSAAVKYPAGADIPDLLDENFPYDGNSWGMTIDLTACIGCNACVIACQTENNIPTVGKEAVARGREMYWIRVDVHLADEAGERRTFFQPVPCMHCEKAPCEQVCPVQATVHSHEGLNMMIYNRCVGTRYCSANCPYGVRRFNYLDYIDERLLIQEVRNPDVSVRVEGVMEKCTYCTQRIKAARIEAKKADRPIADGEIVTACQSACPTNAIIFGNLNDPDAQVVVEKSQPQHYGLLAELNTQPRTTYLARLTNPNETLATGEEA